MEVRLNKTSSINVSVKQNNRKVSLTAGGIKVPGNFKDLDDFDSTNLQGDNIMIYDAETQKFKTLPIDDILEISASDNILPEVFTEKLSQDIDLDAGEF